MWYINRLKNNNLKWFEYPILLIEILFICLFKEKAWGLGRDSLLENKLHDLEKKVSYKKERWMSAKFNMQTIFRFFLFAVIFFCLMCKD